MTSAIEYLTWAALLTLIASVVGYVRFRLVSSKYWSARNVPHLRPNFIVGNTWRMSVSENIINILKNIHLENKRKKIVGAWMYTRPVLLVMDFDVAKRILIKDFGNFTDRGIEVNAKTDPLNTHLLLLPGNRWRNLRVKLTPTFTSGKMKQMFPILVECGVQLEEHLRAPSRDGEIVEVKDLMARFTTDVISSCAFGIETNSVKNPNAEFREYGRKFFTPSLKAVVANIVRSMSPTIFRLLKFRMIPKDVSDFFMKAVTDTIEYRERTQTSRNDFLQLIIQLLREGKVGRADKTSEVVDANDRTANDFTMVDAAAQCFVFFLAGFETSSTALTFGLYELSLNPDIQRRLQTEIDDVLDNHKETLNYEAVMEMEYLHMVVQEILRKHPPVGFLRRKAAEEYAIPECGVKLDKGSAVFISISGIHHDPDIYPDPERFDPERFTTEEKGKRDPFAYLPFGEGPRNCIGYRFALMQVKVALVSVLRKYNVEVCSKTPTRIVLDVRGFLPNAVGGMPLVFTRREGCPS